jgi:trans-aconitate 2-methyltransferase
MVTWDPARYLTFADERSRPFHDLLARVGGGAPSKVVDLGCGTGELTATLAARWPEAEVLGIDSSAEMLASTDRLTAEHPGLSFAQHRIQDWRPTPDTDLVVSNAALQWVPDHRELLQSWAGLLQPGTRIAVQVPANEDSPSQSLLRELAAEPRWADTLETANSVIPRVGAIRDYLGIFLAEGHRIDGWETTYQHILTGEDAVLHWLEGTRLRAYRAALGDRADAFVAELRPRLREAYPMVDGVTVFPFRRLFFVAAIEG